MLALPCIARTFVALGGESRGLADDHVRLRENRLSTFEELGCRVSSALSSRVVLYRAACV